MRERDIDKPGLRLFSSSDAEARFLALYDERVRAWSAPCEELDVPTRYGDTHVIASGPLDAPPLVLLHAFDASATIWRPNAAGLSRDRRVYAPADIPLTQCQAARVRYRARSPARSVFQNQLPQRWPQTLPPDFPGKRILP